MDKKDLDDPRNRRPAVPPEEKSVNAKRQVPARPGAGAGGDEDAYSIDPQEEPAHQPEEERTGAISDRARGERALFDREDAPDPDADASEDGEERLTRSEPPAVDEVEVRRVKR